MRGGLVLAAAGLGAAVSSDAGRRLAAFGTNCEMKIRQHELATSGAAAVESGGYHLGSAGWSVAVA